MVMPEGELFFLRLSWLSIVLSHFINVFSLIVYSDCFSHKRSLLL